MVLRNWMAVKAVEGVRTRPAQADVLRAQQVSEE